MKTALKIVWLFVSLVIVAVGIAVLVTRDRGGSDGGASAPASWQMWHGSGPERSAISLGGGSYLCQARASSAPAWPDGTVRRTGIGSAPTGLPLGYVGISIVSDQEPIYASPQSRQLLHEAPLIDGSAVGSEFEEGSASIRVLGGGYTLAVDAKYAVDWQVTCTPS